MIFTMLAGACGSTEHLASSWRTADLVVDGDRRDWAGIPFHTVKSNLEMAVTNDGEYLYVCLLSRDPMLHMLFRRAGFTVWLDASGGDKKTFGINFPVHGGAAPMMPDNNDRENMGTRRRLLEDLPVEMDIVGPGEKDRYRVSAVQDVGIKAKIGRGEEGTMVYELSVPLRKSKEHQYAVGVTDPLLPIGVGLETGELTGDASRRPPERGGRGGFGGESMRPPEGRGEPGSDEQQGGGGHRGERGIGGSRPDPISVWYLVQLGGTK
jgi:hypothetical protein